LAARSAQDSLERLYTLTAPTLGPGEVARRLVASAFELIVFVAALPDGTSGSRGSWTTPARCETTTSRATSPWMKPLRGSPRSPRLVRRARRRPDGPGSLPQPSPTCRLKASPKASLCAALASVWYFAFHSS